MRLKVDMQPLGAALSGQNRGPLDQAGRDALPSEFGIDTGIEKEGVNAAIPGNVDKTYQPQAGKCTDMGEAS